nr:RNA polymerase beta subunit [Streptosarcina sp. YL-2023a]
MDDIDHLKNRRVKASGELIQTQIGTGFLRLEKLIREKMKKPKRNLSIRNLITTKPFNGALREFFGSSQLSQFMDQTNPLAEITHKRRVSSLGPGGISRETAGMAVRGIHPTHYGRICPIETPEGQNAGLVNSITTHAKVNSLGFLETPFYKVYLGQIQTKLGAVLFSAEKEENIKVAPGDLNLSDLNFLPKKSIPIRISEEFKKTPRNAVEYIALSPIQMISIATSLIPFLEHDDANRALMGSNMQRQAVPLINPERPIVGTGLEARVASDSGHLLQAKELQTYQRSNQDTCVTQRPVGCEGDWIQKGDLLADGTASVSGELALGKNVLVAYMPWEGYNFEDAILISERLVYDDVYTSLHIERYDLEIRDTKYGVEQITNQIPEIDLKELEHLENTGIAKTGSWVKEGDILVGKVTPIQKKPLSPHEKLLYDIVGKEIPTTRDSSLRVPKGIQGRVIDVQILDTETIPPEIAFEGPGRVHIFLAEKRKIQVGDKLAGRHGNKGIVSRILPRQDMPYLPDGTPIDMVLNPLGVPSRMNVGQVFECLLGLAGVYLKQQYKITPFDEIYGPEASRSLVYSKLYEARLKTGQEWLFNPTFPGKTKLFDGRSGECFDQAITVGQAYVLKLVHLVDEKIHARSTGPYSLVTQQPLRGRSKHGGQRLGEMEVWALEGFGAAYTLQELLTVKSDDMKGRHRVLGAILTNDPISLGTPESFKVLVRELQSLCLDVGVFKLDSAFRRKQVDIMKSI